MSDVLSTITDISELSELRDLYLQNWPQHCVGYYALDNFTRWLQKDSKVKNIQIYTLNGEWRTDGLCIIKDRYQLFVNSLLDNSDTKRLKALYLIDWSIGLKVSSLVERHTDAVRTVIKCKKLSLEYDSPTLLYYLPRDQALQLEIKFPPNFALRDLCDADAEIINHLWPNKHQGSLFLIKRLIAWNANIGVYKRDTNELVACCLRLQGGLLGVLQVKENYKRLGLGTLVVKAIAQKIAHLQHDILAAVNEDNIPSRRLFDCLNFKAIDKVYWIRTVPTLNSFQWPNDI